MTRETFKESTIKKYNLAPAHTVMIGQYLDLLLQFNRTINLTGVDNAERGWEELIAPALGFCQHTMHATGIADIGSGNGIPGVIISIMNNSVPVSLIECRKNRIAFLREVKYQLGLSYEIIHQRAEEITYRSFSHIVGFRVADLPTFLTIAHPIINDDGMVVQMVPDFSPKDQRTIIDKTGRFWYYTLSDDNFIECSIVPRETY
ncbi:MAG TPA: 16S rRNA (guanine(527)-N(7))-methyltransferase RsmG [bacterium]|nr:16S rRNA (guanine(527)-N(7))-methyltransferase RsmG [bacterium]